MSEILNRYLDVYDKLCQHNPSRLTKDMLDRALAEIQIDSAVSVNTKNKNSQGFAITPTMSRLYSRLAKLQRELMSAQTDEEREEIEDQIAEIEDEIELEESGKYDNDNDY